MSRHSYSIFFSVGRVTIITDYLQGDTSMVGPSVPQEGLRKQQLFSCSFSSSLTFSGSQGLKTGSSCLFSSTFSFPHFDVPWAIQQSRVYFTYTWLWVGCARSVISPHQTEVIWLLGACLKCDLLCWLASVPMRILDRCQIMSLFCAVYFNAVFSIV